MAETHSPAPEHTATFQTGIAVAIALAILATLLGIFALGRSLSLDSQPTVAAVPGPDTAGDQAPAAITVTLSEFAIASAADTVPAGAPVTVTNDGAVAHDLAIRDTDITTVDLDAGASDTLDLSGLTPGTYEWLCTIPGHEQAGMVGSVTITADGAVAEAAPPPHRTTPWARTPATSPRRRLTRRWP